MPKKVERAIRREGRKKGFTGRRLDRYVYGGLRRTGWKPRRRH